MAKNSYIKKRKAQNVFNAFELTEWLGCPYNLVVVIHLEDTLEKSANTAFREILQKYRVWQNYKSKKLGLGLSPSYSFAHENPNNNPHVHLVFYIPEELISEFKRKLPVWVEKVQGPIGPKTVKCSRIDHYSYKSIANYMMKGIEPEHVDRFNLRPYVDKKGFQGVVHGQRAGFSRNSGPRTVRRNKTLHGFCPTTQRRERKKRYEYWRSVKRRR